MTPPAHAPPPRLPPFHLAFPVHDIALARHFYGATLGCAEGRSAETWVDFNFFGHQIVAHQIPGHPGPSRNKNPVDGHDVPVPHFGVVLAMPQWATLAARLTQANTCFVIPPHIRFKGEPGEQATMFLLDPSGNALEFKAFANVESLFAT